MLIGNGWVGAFQDLQKADEAMQKVIDKLPETYATKKEVKDLSDITVPIISNRPPTENDAGVPGKKWIVPYIVFKNIYSDVWTATGADAITSDGVTTFTGDGTVANIEAESATLDNSTAGHIIYFRATVTAIAASNSINVTLLSASNAVVFEQTISVPDATSVHELSGYFTANANISKIKVTSTYNSSATQLDKTVSIEKIILVDLTADMCQSRSGLEFTEEEAIVCFEKINTFSIYTYKYSENEWICRGINEKKYKWLMPVDEASARSSYLAFVGNANINMINAAFGMNNEWNVKGVGLALAMYASFNDTNLDANRDFLHLIHAQTFEEICNNQEMFAEIYTSVPMRKLIQASTYAKSLFDAVEPLHLSKILGLTNVYTSLQEIFEAEETMTKLIRCNTELSQWQRRMLLEHYLANNNSSVYTYLNTCITNNPNKFATSTFTLHDSSNGVYKTSTTDSNILILSYDASAGKHSYFKASLSKDGYKTAETSDRSLTTHTMPFLASCDIKYCNINNAYSGTGVFKYTYIVG